MGRAHRFGDRYDGRNHSQYACLIKRYASFLNRPLNPDEQSQLIPLLRQNLKPSWSWGWRSLTTTVHSLTSAGVFTPHKLSDESVKRAQAALLSTLLAPVTIKCNQKPEAKDIDGQGITNLLWAMAKLVDNGQELTPALKEAVAAPLQHVNAQKANFRPLEIANLLWALGKLGELVELNLVQSTLDLLVNVIRETPQIFSQRDRLMSLWGVTACCARFSLDSNAKKNDLPEKLLDDLFAHLENKSPESKEEQPTIAMAAIWLGRECPVAPHYLTTTSSTQSIFRRQLQSRIPSLKIEEEKSLNALPPVDLLLPDHKIAIEILGPSHYVGGDFQTRTGSTLLKIALLQRLGLEVIEIPVNKLNNKDSLERVIDQVKTKLNIPP